MIRAFRRSGSGVAAPSKLRQRLEVLPAQKDDQTTVGLTFDLVKGDGHILGGHSHQTSDFHDREGTSAVRVEHILDNADPVVLFVEHRLLPDVVRRQRRVGGVVFRIGFSEPRDVSELFASAAEAVTAAARRPNTKRRR